MLSNYWRSFQNPTPSKAICSFSRAVSSRRNQGLQKTYTHTVIMLALHPLQDSNANHCSGVLIRGNQMSIMPSIVQIMISPTSSALSLLWIQTVDNKLFKNESLWILWGKLLSKDWCIKFCIHLKQDVHLWSWGIMLSGLKMPYILKPCITSYTRMVNLSSTTTPASFLSLTDCLTLLPQELHG